MRRFAIIALALTLLAPCAALAVTPDEMLKNPAQEARARNLSQELRCMVCQNQSIDDSDAPLAHDLRVLVRERIKTGDSDAEVLDYLVARYGEFILLRPRFELHNLLLWSLPPLALILGFAGLIVAVRRRRKAEAEPAALSPAERRRLATLVEPGTE